MSATEYPVKAIVVRVKRLFPAWVGARISNNIIYVREDVALTERFLAHELCHLRQRVRLGWRFLFAYLWGWAAAGFDYEGNRMEQEAREAESDPYYRAWARAVLGRVPA